MVCGRGKHQVSFGRGNNRVKFCAKNKSAKRLSGMTSAQKKMTTFMKSAGRAYQKAKRASRASDRPKSWMSFLRMYRRTRWSMH